MSVAFPTFVRHSRARGNPDGAGTEVCVHYRKTPSLFEPAGRMALYDHLGPRVRGDDGLNGGNPC
jgi:hypothetical protein